MDMIEPDLKFSPSGMVLTHDWGLILAEGPDAGTFLQGQLTNDVLLLPPGQARFAGYCSAKGRLLASFIVLKISQEKFILVCQQDLLQATLKRLSMFVMRAKVKLSDATGLYETHGLLGTAADQACPSLTAELPWKACVEGEGGFVKLHSAMNSGLKVSRLLWIGLKADAATDAFLSQSIAQTTLVEWHLAEVLSGISMVHAATSEAFVPQMLNYESVEGVSFKKGCYPGQEVVARSQFRGTLKRRAFIVSGQAPMQAGQEIFSDEDSDQACGLVACSASIIGAAPVDVDPHWGIVSMQTSAVSQGLRLGTATGSQLQVSALPYHLLEDI